MANIKTELDRRRGVTFTLRQGSINKLDAYIKAQQEGINPFATINRQTVLETLVERFLSDTSKPVKM